MECIIFEAKFNIDFERQNPLLAKEDYEMKERERERSDAVWKKRQNL